jgi:hypothetical protein
MSKHYNDPDHATDMVMTYMCSSAHRSNPGEDFIKADEAQLAVTDFFDDNKIPGCKEHKLYQDTIIPVKVWEAVGNVQTKKLRALDKPEQQERS